MGAPREILYTIQTLTPPDHYTALTLSGVPSPRRHYEARPSFAPIAGRVDESSRRRKVDKRCHMYCSSRTSFNSDAS